MILLSLLISFFGIFLFPIAGFILGKLNYRYLAFGAVCFFWGLFMIGNRVSVYLNLWITDPTVCMAVDILMVRIFMISVLCYLKSNLINKVTRLIANITITVYTLVVIATVILHFAAVTDLFSNYNAVNICTMIGIVIMTLLLFIESGQNSQAIFMLIAWTPLTLSIILDVFNYFLQFTDIHFYYFGLSLTMLYQITRMVLDLRKQYLEAIRYQQMQKELYEAKVAVMTSQIRPHFMYNALTSIAMMCELDPKTAKQATITFAKYLRGNMDSLKQTAPVPFTQELEHLKKYLYIEKLRFDDLLNIEYDIQATDFVLPLLSIQPLVENAVKHGVGMKEDGGTVKISTRETETAYEVVIEDDGVGFDVNEQKDDGRSHVGMENTKKRLRDMCGGEVKITSVIGKGTTAIVVLPKEGQPDENTMS